MLDLKKLAEKLSDALAKETPQSLTSWLTGKRSKNLDKYMGDGKFVANVKCLVVHTSIPQNEMLPYRSIIKVTVENCYCDNDDISQEYSYAA